MKYFIISFIIFFASQITADTTYVSGGISTNTVWDTAGSPYVVISDVSVGDSAILRIEPGVKVAIYPGKSIGIYGRLSAIGTTTDPILFTKSSSQEWSCLSFAATAHCSLKYCIILYALNSAIYNCSNDYIYIGYCTIQNNRDSWRGAISNLGFAIITNNDISNNLGYICSGFCGIFNAGTADITNNIIVNNNNGFEGGGGVINYGEATITGNIISANAVGIWNDSSATIMNNSIVNNCGNGGGGIRNDGPAVIIGNTISNSFGGGICNSYDSVLISHNIIARNECGGWAHANNIDNSGSFVTIKNNTIIDSGWYGDSTWPSIYNSGSNVVICSTNIYSKYYAIKNDSTDSVDARYNYWNTTDTLVIDSKIWDFYDDFAKGIVYYKPFLVESLIAIEEDATHQEDGGQELKTQSSNLKIIGNKIYLSLPLTIDDLRLTIFDICGRLRETIYSGTLTKGNYTFTPNLKTTGIYFVTLSAGDYKETKKLISIK